MEDKNSKNLEKSIQHRRFEGEVLNSKDKTIRVLVTIYKKHPKYEKTYISSKKYAVHDEKGRAKVGDRVLFEECRPLSKTKRWTLVNILNQA